MDRICGLRTGNSIDCHDCGGTEKCQSCGGTGKHPDVPNCNCPGCDGSRKCSYAPEFKKATI